MTNKERHLAIIGGGAAGISAFIAAIKRGASDCITIIDPHSIGRGMVYGTTDLELLCNTSVDLMSVVSDNSWDLLEYLQVALTGRADNSALQTFTMKYFQALRTFQIVIHQAPNRRFSGISVEVKIQPDSFERI